MRVDAKQKVIRLSYFRLWSNYTIEKNNTFSNSIKKAKIGHLPNNLMESNRHI
jgi:hypothetical protein